MVTSRYKRKGKNKVTVCENYKCRTQEESGKSVCKGQRFFSAKKIDGLFLQELEVFLTRLDVTELEGHYRERVRSARKEARQECHKLEKKLNQSKKLFEKWLERLDHFLLDPGSSLYSEEILANKVKEYEKQTRELEAQLDSALQDAAVETWENEQMRLFAQIAPRWFELFRDAPLAQQKQMLRSVIDTVEIGKGTLTINCALNLALFVESAGQKQPEEKKAMVMPFP